MEYLHPTLSQSAGSLHGLNVRIEQRTSHLGANPTVKLGKDREGKKNFDIRGV